MDDKLEKFIKTHRAELDRKEPSADLWNRISTEIAPKENKPATVRTLPYWRAAAAILLVVSLVLAYDKYTSKPEIVADSGITEQMLVEAEGFYIDLINQKKSELSAYSDQHQADGRLNEDINRLDSIYQELKSEMAYGNEESVLNAMIQNLQLRIELLSNQLEILQSIERAKKTENENFNI